MFVSPEWRCPKEQVPLYLHACIRVRYSELSPNLSAIFGGYVFHILLSTLEFFRLIWKISNFVLLNYHTDIDDCEGCPILMNRLHWC